MQQPLCFEDTDVGGPPAPGWYASTITTACWRRSVHGNRMVYLVVALDGVGSPYDRIADYFVLEGVTPRGVACSRRRLVTAFRAGGLAPRAGDEIQPEVLEGLTIEVRLAHESWKGKVRLQITGYRPRAVSPEPETEAIGEDTAQLSSTMQQEPSHGD
jgi:hypothetical protein